jgi:hypothetical protein
MTIDNRPNEIPAVWPEQIAMALTFVRAAVLDETVEEAILPLSDRGTWTALREPDAMQRGIGVIRIRFESCDGIHPVVQRVVCFLLLLREQSQNHNQDAAFDVVIFAKIAGHIANGASAHLSSFS